MTTLRVPSLTTTQIAVNESALGDNDITSMKRNNAALYRTVKCNSSNVRRAHLKRLKVVDIFQNIKNNNPSNTLC